MIIVSLQMRVCGMSRPGLDSILDLIYTGKVFLNSSWWLARSIAMGGKKRGPAAPPAAAPKRRAGFFPAVQRPQNADATMDAGEPVENYMFETQYV
jgi:hypothetical protein